MQLANASFFTIFVNNDIEHINFNKRFLLLGSFSWIKRIKRNGNWLIKMRLQVGKKRF